MATNDAYNVYDTIELISAVGVKKSKERIDHTIIKSILAGIFLSFSGLFLLTVGGGGAPIDQTLGPGVHKMIQASVFPIGLILIVITGADLFTGNTMTLVVSTLHRKTTLLHLIISWIISFFGNLVGCLFFEYIFVYYAGLLATDPYRSFTVKFAEAKGNIGWHQIFLRGIVGNWLVCLALWLGTSARELSSKIIGIFLPIWLFVAVGFEHSIANMFTVQMGMILGADLSVGKYISFVMIPVTLGNILGGGLFVGFIYWYLYLLKKVVIIDVESSPVNNVDQTVKKNEAVAQSQQQQSFSLSFDL
jgi:formate/nitrite transporter